MRCVEANGVFGAVLTLANGNRMSVRAAPPGVRLVEQVQRIAVVQQEGWSVGIFGPLNRPAAT
jgi:hypothetical protein